LKNTKKVLKISSEITMKKFGVTALLIFLCFGVYGQEAEEKERRVGLGAEGYGGWYYNTRGQYYASGGLSLGVGSMLAPVGTGAVIVGVSSDYLHLGGHFKWHFYEHNMVNWAQFFMAGGVALDFGFYSRGPETKGNFTTALALRAAVGFRFFLMEQLDIFVSLDPMSGVEFTPGSETDKVDPYVNLGGSLGIRYWF
jgi:hypothetical protein